LSGARYEGEWVEGNERGQGTIVWPNGDRYEGGWRDGKQHGYGIGVWANGARFEGVWREGKRDGFGTMIWPNGVSYEGDWVNGSETGHGIFETANGDRHEGDFIDGSGSTNRGAYISKSDLGIMYVTLPLGKMLSSRTQINMAEQMASHYKDAAINAESSVEACNFLQRRL